MSISKLSTCLYLLAVIVISMVAITPQAVQADTDVVRCAPGNIHILDPSRDWTAARCIPEDKFHPGEYNYICTGDDSWLVVRDEKASCETFTRTSNDPQTCNRQEYRQLTRGQGVLQCELNICEHVTHGAFLCPEQGRKYGGSLREPSPPTGSVPPTGSNPGSGTTTCSGSVANCKIFMRLNQILNIMAILVVPIASIVILVGGIQYTAAGGNPEAIKGARARIFNGALALVCFLLMWSFLKWLIPGDQLQ